LPSPTPHAARSHRSLCFEKERGDAFVLLDLAGKLFRFRAAAGAEDEKNLAHSFDGETLLPFEGLAQRRIEQPPGSPLDRRREERICG
jgi:hypothetical protein